MRDGGAIYAALLTPQGKFLHDFFVFEIGETLHLECEAARLDDLKRRLTMYKLRAKVQLEEVDATFQVYALLGVKVGDIADLTSGAIYPDPRLAALGARAALRRGSEGALEAGGCSPATKQDYDILRLELGVPDGSRDLVVDKSFLLDYGFEELNGIDFEKGCYVGQEVTVRMKHRGRLRKRLVPVNVAGPAPAPGTPILHRSIEAGELRSVTSGRGLALLKLDHLEAVMRDGTDLTAGEARITLKDPPTT